MMIHKGNYIITNSFKKSNTNKFVLQITKHMFRYYVYLNLFLFFTIYKICDIKL